MKILSVFINPPSSLILTIVLPFGIVLGLSFLQNFNDFKTELHVSFYWSSIHKVRGVWHGQSPVAI